jgi:exopolysaccharide biosynthesis polyprenyl glycosylphosphotransferase
LADKADTMSGQLKLWSSAEDHNQHLASADAVRTRPGQRSSRALKRQLMLADSIAVLVGFLAAFLMQRAVRPLQSDGVSQHAVLMLISLPGFAFGAAALRLHQARANERPSQEVLNIVRAVWLGVAFMIVLAFTLQFRELSRLWIGLVTVCVTGALIAERWVARKVFSRMRADGRLTRRIVIVGTDAHAIGLLHTYQRNPALGYEVVGFVGEDDLGPRGGVSVLGGLSDLERVLQEHEAVGVVVSLQAVGHEEVNTLTRRLTDNGYHVALSSSLSDIDVTRLRPQQVDGRTMIYVEPVIRHGWRGVAKRTFDVAVASLLLVITLPVLIVAVVAIKLDSQGPVFFRQERVGRYGSLFTLLKLRTMVADAELRRHELLEFNEVDGPLFKIHRDPRITRVGRVLRKFSIDELPQLLCVLRGSMSMVGPRPALPSEVEQWDQSLHERLRVMPGLTGLWQISGRSDSSFDQYRRLDLYYVDNWSLGHDLRICARTFAVVISGRGAA